MERRIEVARRTFLRTTLTAGAAALGMLAIPNLSFACGCDPTASNIEGPFFREGAPVRTALASRNDAGTRLVIGGRVRATTCRPVRNGVLEVWQADAHGGYDMSGYRFRATVRAAEDGTFAFRTIVPGRYLNGAQYRPAHVHVKVHSDGNPTLTTQLYFAGDPYNDADPWFEESLALRPEVVNGERRASFDFVI
jgi:protocatechuate 3,4-dioxygenase beta subunit